MNCEKHSFQEVEIPDLGGTSVTPGSVLLNMNCSSGKEKHININKFAGLSRDWVGAKILFMCFFFSGHSLWGRKNT